MAAKKFFGWINTALLTIIMFITFGLAMHSGTLYIVPVCNEMGITRTEYGVTLSIATLVGFFAALTLGRFLKILKSVKKVITLGIFSCIIFLAIYGSAPNIYVMYISGFFRGFISPYLGIGLMSILVSKWFIDKKNIALGFIAFGSGIGGTILSPIVSFFITNFGWRGASLISAGIIAVISIPALLFVREEPEKYGQLPLGMKAEGDSEYQNRPLKGLLVELAPKTPFFWVGIAGVALGSVAASTFYINSAAMLEEKSLAPVLIPPAISALFLFNTIAKAGVGVILDKFGIKKTMIISYILIMISSVCMLFAGNPAFAFLYAVLFGLGFSFFSSPFAALVENLVGPKDYGSIIGYFMAAMQFGQSLAPIITGAAFDITGSYNIAIIMMVAFIFTSLIVLMKALKMSEKYFAERLPS
ncbi:MFS transporter [Tyzzerella sp. OttesenSCG-928-J15]|nr:MFS transporter [Tyzzerella sp. OttesenSCG-928-J15]